MTCKRCGSDEITRSRRRGIWDRIQSALGHWPYRCDNCNYRFVASYRYLGQAPAGTNVPPHNTPGEDFRSYAASATQGGPDIAFQTHTEKPHAKIVLQADTHEQLNNILLALNHAVSTYQTSSNQTSSKAKTESAAR